MNILVQNKPRPRLCCRNPLRSFIPQPHMLVVARPARPKSRVLSRFGAWNRKVGVRGSASYGPESPILPVFPIGQASSLLPWRPLLFQPLLDWIGASHALQSWRSTGLYRHAPALLQWPSRKCWASPLRLSLPADFITRLSIMVFGIESRRWWRFLSGGRYDDCPEPRFWV